MSTVGARTSVTVSFFVISIVGAAFVFAFWANQSLTVAAGRSILLVIIMAGVHLAGYILYVQQDEPDQVEPVSRKTVEVSRPYWPALRNALLLQSVLGMFTALLLDGGRSFTFFGVALLAHWIGIILIVARRPTTPTEFDLSFIRIGILPIFVLTGAISPLVWRIIGESDLSGWQRLWGA
jgi:hypothetical protein